MFYPINVMGGMFFKSLAHRSFSFGHWFGWDVSHYFLQKIGKMQIKLKFFGVIILSLIVLSGTFLISCDKDKVVYVAPPNCSDTISFNQEILPFIQNYCTGCHDVGNGTGYTLTNHGNISVSADAILGSIRSEGYLLMPQGGPALPDSLIKKMECWIYQGKLDN